MALKKNFKIIDLVGVYTMCVGGGLSEEEGRV